MSRSHLPTPTYFFYRHDGPCCSSPCGASLTRLLSRHLPVESSEYPARLVPKSGHKRSRLLFARGATRAFVRVARRSYVGLPPLPWTGASNHLQRRCPPFGGCPSGQRTARSTPSSSWDRRSGVISSSALALTAAYPRPLRTPAALPGNGDLADPASSSLGSDGASPAPRLCTSALAGLGHC